MSVGLNGLKGQVIKVEATVRNDKEQQCIIIGLPDATIKESRERILNSLHSLALDIEMKKITINLSPADLKKSGTGFNGATRGRPRNPQKKTADYGRHVRLCSTSMF